MMKITAPLPSFDGKITLHGIHKVASKVSDTKFPIDNRYSVIGKGDHVFMEAYFQLLMHTPISVLYFCVTNHFTNLWFKLTAIY